MPCKTRLAQTAFYVLRQLLQRLAVWLGGLSRVSQCLHTANADCRAEFDAVGHEIERAIRYLEAEAGVFPRNRARTRWR